MTIYFEPIRICQTIRTANQKFQWTYYIEIWIHLIFKMYPKKHGLKMKKKRESPRSFPKEENDFTGTMNLARK